MTPRKRQRLTAMGEVAAQSAVGQITQGNYRLIQVALAPEPLSGMLPAETAVTVRPLLQLELPMWRRGLAGCREGVSRPPRQRHFTVEGRASSPVVTRERQRAVHHRYAA